MSLRSGEAALLFFLGPVMAVQAHAEIYMSEQQAATVIFPSEKFDRIETEITSVELEKIEKLLPTKLRSKKLLLYKSSEKSIVFIDQVIGKHEFITYAVGIDKQGKIAGIEILEYRESYGSQIKKSAWRAQFKNKDKNSKLELNIDISNISGATLSSAHVTTGVKKIIQVYDTIKTRI